MVNFDCSPTKARGREVTSFPNIYMVANYRMFMHIAILRQRVVLSWLVSTCCRLEAGVQARKPTVATVPHGRAAAEGVTNPPRHISQLKSVY